MKERLTYDLEGKAISALWYTPSRPVCAIALAHGAGAGMEHPFLERLARQLLSQSVATLRFQFPYMEQGRRFPDRPVVLMNALKAAVGRLHDLTSLPIFWAGKSMGGRMFSHLAASEELPPPHGLIFYGFPLHKPGEPSSERAAHLTGINLPTLFLSGERDRMGDVSLLKCLTESLGPKCVLSMVPKADHGFCVPKKCGMNDEQVSELLAMRTVDWCHKYLACI